MTKLFVVAAADAVVDDAAAPDPGLGLHVPQPNRKPTKRSGFLN